MTTMKILETLIQALSEFAVPEITETAGATCVFEMTKKVVWFRCRGYRDYSAMQEKIFAVTRILSATGANFIVTVSGNYGYNHISLGYTEIIDNDFGDLNIEHKIEIHIDNMDN